MLTALLCCCALQDDVAARAMPSVVVVSVSGREGEATGTGFVIAPDGLIATNLHVVGEARPIRVKFADGRVFDVTAVHAAERSTDLAILKIEARDLPALPLAEGDLPAQGVRVVAIGNPHGLAHSVVSGVVSAHREVDGRTMIQLALPTEPGNSGGPLLDMEGRVHGILTLRSAVTENIGFAMPVRALRPLIEKPNPVPMARWLTIGQLDAAEWTIRDGARWRQRAGRIEVVGAGSGFGGRALCFSSMKVPEPPYELAVTVRVLEADGAAGLLFSADGGDKHYGFYPTGSQLRLTRFEGPTVFDRWTILQTVDSPHYRPGEWNTIKVRVEKERLLCYVNDQLAIESNDVEYRAGSVGLAKFRHTTAEFKRFRLAERIAPDAAGEPARLRDRARVLEREAEGLRREAAVAHDRAVREQISKDLAADDLLRAALRVALLDNEDVDVEAYVEHIDRIARRLPKEAPEADRLKALDECFFRELMFHGSRTDYYDRSNSYLNEVIDDREGLPISLSVLYIELARRIGLKVVGVGLPGHFVVRFEPKEGEGRLIDVFEGGRVMPAAEARLLMGSVAPLPVAGTTPIILRMLRNLMGAARDDASRRRYVDVMLELAPDHLEARVARLDLLVRAGDYAAALEDVDAVLKLDLKPEEARRLGELREQLERQLRNQR